MNRRNEALDDPHPLVVFCVVKGISRREGAAALGVRYGVFRQLVAGHAGTSFARAERWEEKSGGLIKAIDVMRWQERNRKSGRAAA